MLFVFLICVASAVDYTQFDNLRIYQVMVSSFQNGDPKTGYGIGYGPSAHKGDLRGIIKAIPYIKSLGMNTLWMTPIFNSNGNSLLDSTGYFCYDYFNIDPKFGTISDFQELVTTAHSNGLYVILDGVFGHHKDGAVAKSPSGKLPQGGSNPVSYPGSLEFYQEVAKFWIEKYEIDGWRLDQAYQVSTKNQNSNYWVQIRKVVEDTCNARKKAGKKFGILGYMVGEIWDNAANIVKYGYTGTSGKGLLSCFDFPSRYALVETFAMSETGASTQSAGRLADIYKMNYPSDFHPNLFISNHDVWRFGNLIRRKFGITRQSTEYWLRHKAIFGVLASYSGPITIYYGDEVGDLVGCYTKSGDCNGAYDDNMARTDGHITGFNKDEQDLHDYVAKLMKLRAANPALYKGSRQSQDISGTLYKLNKVSGNNKIQVLINTNNFSFKTDCSLGTDLVSGKKITNKLCELPPFAVLYIKQ
ncbi:alpha-amylase, putative [Entamoeba invadens IP1]|uniref:alpha-amylase, putative n=1 Tax=Entamoeba invadens IP1 TaxID=370355 RepID=UPI0002C3F0E0|nr:alpha-amylase, putative [Entamoeba invadens IP1]ELP85299.1 alpha-amylase, putative [Entamoeba invadens IP1]|eukprot:XP_004184645.1 alpha-amylase, putative [Entamoeba invadens IP1]